MSSEYGWTDQVIDEIPLARFRQITSAIQTRKFLAFREENARTSWMVRQITAFIANGYMVEGENTAVKAAEQIGYDDIEIALLTGEAPLKPGEVRNNKGSYESLMRFAGGMTKR